MRLFFADIFWALSSFLYRGSRFFFAVGRGLLSTSDISRRNQRFWDETIAFQTPDHVHAGLFDWEEAAYAKALPKSGRIGVIGCGAGRDMIALHKKGYVVEGIDFSPVCINKAQEFLAQYDLSEKAWYADAHSFQFEADSLDAAIFSWFTYAYIPGQKNRIESLERLRASLRSEGKVILTLTRSLVGRPSEKIDSVSRFFAKLTGNSEHLCERDIIEISRTCHKSQPISYNFFFDRESLEAEANAAGFEVQEYDDQNEYVAIAILTPAASAN